MIASSDNEIRGNSISDALYGIDLFLASNSNIIEDNTFSMNSDNIILMDSNDNEIQRNDFLLNQRQAYDSGANFWNQNYWDDYSGTDEDGDGFGDTPYPISGTLVDEAPKISPYEDQQVPVPALIPAEIQVDPWEIE